MNKDSLFMVVKDTEYTNRVPVQIGTLHINEALASVTKANCQLLGPEPISHQSLYLNQQLFWNRNLI